MTNTIKATRATIKLGDINLDCLQFPNGTYHFFINQLNDVLSIKASNSTGQKYLQPLLEANPNQVNQASVEGIKSHLKTLSIELVVQAISVYAGLGNQRCINVTIACMAEALERRADAAFGITRTEEQRDERIIQRLAPRCTVSHRKKVFKMLCKYYDRESYRITETEGKIINVGKLSTVKINEAIFGQTHFNLNRLNMTSEQQYAVAVLEEDLFNRLYENRLESLDSVLNTAIEAFVTRYGNFYHLDRIREHEDSAMDW